MHISKDTYFINDVWSFYRKIANIGSVRADYVNRLGGGVPG